MFLFSPNETHVSDEFEVQPYVFGLAFTGLKRRVQRTSRSSSCHHQTLTLNIQLTLERKHYEIRVPVLLLILNVLKLSA